MTSLRNQLPPPNALVAFEATARHLSFTKAAQELLVTQAAVSRQIRLLEDYLGVRVFRRIHRGIQLTKDGDDFYKTVTMSLTLIANKASSVRHAASPSHLTIAASNAVASLWLMPRITSFKERFPEFQIRVITSDPPLDPTIEGVDAVVRHGNGKWPGLKSTLLMEEEVLAVCSSSYLQEQGPFSTIDDLAQSSLLHLDIDSRVPVTWQTWLQQFGYQTKTPLAGPRYSSYLTLIYAALSGQGIVLGWKQLIKSFLTSGTLVRAYPKSAYIDGAYYLAVADGAKLNRATTAFREWIGDEAGATRRQKKSR